MVNKFEDFDSLINFSPQTTGKKKKELFLQMLRYLVSSAKKKKKYAKQIRFSIQMFLISKCVNISAQMLLGYFQFVCFKESTFIDIITQQNWSNTLSVYFFFEGFPNFWKIIDHLNFIIIGFRMQFVELKIDISSDNSSCWLRHPKVVLVYYFTCIIVIYHVQSLPFVLKLIFVSFSM